MLRIQVDSLKNTSEWARRDYNNRYLIIKWGLNLHQAERFHQLKRVSWKRYMKIKKLTKNTIAGGYYIPKQLLVVMSAPSYHRTRTVTNSQSRPCPSSRQGPSQNSRPKFKHLLPCYHILSPPTQLSIRSNWFQPLMTHLSWPSFLMSISRSLR